MLFSPNFTSGELMVFFNIHIIYTIFKSEDVLVSGFRSMLQHGCRCDGCQKVCLNAKTLHFAANSTHDSQCTDKLWKIRSVLLPLQESFLAAVDPEKCQMRR